MSLHFTTLATTFALGVAVGQMRTCRDFRDAAPMLDTDADGTPDFGHAASGFERLIEPYYRWRVYDKFDVSPDWQYISRPAGNGDKTMNLIGLRAQVTLLIATGARSGLRNIHDTINEGRRHDQN